MTDAQVRALKPKRRRYAVTVARRLQMVVMPSGTKSWVYRVTRYGQRAAVHMGYWPKVRAKEALRRRDHLDDAEADGLDLGVRFEKLLRMPARRTTLAEFAERWLNDVARKVRKDPRPVERMLKRDILPALGTRSLAQIEVTDVTRLVFARRDACRPEAAAAMRHLLKRIFDYAIACSEATVNPAAHVPMKFVAQHRARTRSLSEAEIGLFLQRLPAIGRIGWALELMLLTLCRKSELRLAQWEHIDFAKHLWEVPAELSKTGKPHIVYLSPRAMWLFDRLKGAAGRARFVLPLRDSISEPMGAATINKAIARVKWGFPHFTPHDLRRTASTILNEQGYNPDWIEACLNHAPRGVRGVYNRARWAEQRRQMLAEWADYIGRLSE
ncbi:MAG: tyrosine-type recombinase/integrase [Patescibacteria group bacterium]|nr:tyrosine-type recombinase/integrase [Patescibacteria group bacterium]